MEANLVMVLNNLVKKTLFLISLISSVFMYSQQHVKRHVVEYLNMSSISIAKNHENYYFRTDKMKSNGTSGGVDINTIHGIKFYELVAISGGLALDLNVNSTFFSTPYFIDVRVFSNKSGQDGFFAYLQSGRNIQWSNSSVNSVSNSKLGVGVIINQTDNRSFYIDLFSKSRQLETKEFDQKGYYNVNGFGLSLGLVFN